MSKGIKGKKHMTKFKVDTDKQLHEQSYWHRLKPEAKLMATESWKAWGKEVDKLIATGEIVIDPTIHKRSMVVSIPNDQLMEKEDLN